ncbi:nucleotidyltransferase family protein [uncultured Mucilaginibacter sp.]|uniref:type VII toxin-antitoxin system MntA family adenylyltransferase antitoxin n=1 Tax=uncultured Mucilaginibacter sp. TaxID=797541 RepID=UPI00263654DD|nr:nucleotidyltransferase family protein [uncultured Mucilaginibacter sp.]
MLSVTQQNQIIEITSKFNPKLIGIFGSFARGENKPNSDLDILIDFEQDLNLLEIIGLEQELTEVLGIKVDLITLKSLNPALKKYIEKDLILLQLPVFK